MDSKELLTIFDCEQRRDIIPNDAAREVTPHVIRHVPSGPHARWGWIIYSQVTPDNADTVIAEQVAYFDTLGLSFEWKWYGHDAPPDLPDRLLAHGFAAEADESVMVLDLAEAPAWVRGTPDPRVRRLTDRDQLIDVVTVENSVWPDKQDWIAEELAAEMELAPDEISIYCAYEGGLPASAAWVRFHPGTHFASLWGGSTAAPYRKRGLYTALLAARAREARDKGFRFLTVDASHMSRPILERRGFLCITTTRPYKWRTAAELLH